MTNEAIEVHLTYLRPRFDAMQAALPVLRDKIDQLSEKMDKKFAASNAALVAMIEKADERRAAGRHPMKSTDDRFALKEHGASGPSNEVIQVQLRALRKRVDLLCAQMHSNIDNTNTRLEAVKKPLLERIEKTNEGVRENAFAKPAECLRVPLWVFYLFSTLYMLLLATSWIAGLKAL